MKAGELIVSLFAEMRRERRDCTRIAGLELDECLEITLGRCVLVLLTPKGLECTQRLGPAPEHEIADGTTAKVLHFRRQCCTHAYSGTELLIGSFQPRRNVDG